MTQVTGGDLFSGPAVEAANAVYASNLVHAKSLTSWQRSTRWLTEYEAYAKRVYLESGLRYSWGEAVASNELMRLFLSSVVGHDKGHSVPASARRFLSAERRRRGLESLNVDASISDLLKGAERTTPRTKKQAAPLHEDEVGRLLDKFGCTWVERQVATMTAVGFLSVMRGIELRKIRTDGVCFVLRAGTHLYASKGARTPDVKEVKAILFHVPWRKQNQCKDVWVPLACPRVMQRVIEQLAECTRQGGTEFLFPSVSRRGGKRMHRLNPMGRQQFQSLLQKGLIGVCGFKPAVARLFTGHCLRIGGSNYMRRLGLDDEIHRKLGGWMSIQSSQGYMVLSPKEQAAVCEKMALHGKRHSAFEPGELDSALTGMAALIL